MIMLVVFTWCVHAEKNAPAGRQLQRFIEQELKIDKAVSAHLLDVSVEEGVVAVSGTIDNLLARDRAIEIIASIRGVRGIVDRIEVVPVKQTETQIRKNLLTAYALNPVIEVLEIDFSILGDIVELNGTVDSWTEKQLAERTAKGVKGIAKIINNIVVEPKQKRPADEIEAEIQKRFEIDPVIDEDNVSVMVEDGRVILEGRLGTIAAVRKAYEKAHVNGVAGVNMEAVTVPEWSDPGSTRSAAVTEVNEEEIYRAVMDALFYDPRVVPDEIMVTIDGHRVVLGGTVRTVAARYAAVDDARRCRGVVEVDDNIKVRPESMRTDWEIQKRVEQALLWNPTVERYEITVWVSNGLVTLYGSVDTYYEKKKAAQGIAPIEGIVGIVNTISVSERPRPVKTDYEIEKSIHVALNRRWSINTGNISVSVEDGVAELSGTVQSWDEYEKILNTAFDAGAQEVESNLHIQGSQDFFPRNKTWHWD
jgi:osmotically-inducible protein OsmY